MSVSKRFIIFLLVIFPSLLVHTTQTFGKDDEIISRVQGFGTLDPDKMDKGQSGGRVVDTLTGVIINPKDVYIPEEEGKIKNTMIYLQNLEITRVYKLIVMVDYVQTEFYVDGMPYDSYTFTLENEDGVSLDIEIDLGGRDADGIDYIMIKDPEYNQIQENEEDIDKIMYNRFITHSLLWKVRLRESSSKLESTEFKDIWDQVFDDHGMGMFELVKKLEIVPLEERPQPYIPSEYFQFAFEVKGGDDYSLLITNYHQADMEYAVIQFLDWQQIPFGDGEMIKFTSLPPGSFGQHIITLPQVEDEGIYTVFVCENPFSSEIPPMLISTQRAIISPK